MMIDREINRLKELMPASGRMLTKIVSNPQQSYVINAPMPPLWQPGNRSIYINFELWCRLSQEQRDLILLRTVMALMQLRWLKWDIYQGATVAGLLGIVVEMVQGDVVGSLVAGGLTVFAVTQVWRNNRRLQSQLEADEAAIKIAQRRGYTAVTAAEALLSAIETVPPLEGRASSSFDELIRCQNLRAIANRSVVGVPERVRQQ